MTPSSNATHRSGDRVLCREDANVYKEFLANALLEQKRLIHHANMYRPDSPGTHFSRQQIINKTKESKRKDVSC